MTRMAAVPAWVVVKCSSNAVRLYALLDLNDGVLAVATAADTIGLSKGTVQRGLRELRDSGAIKRVGNARYEMHRDPPVSISPHEFSPPSTELSTDRQHADPQGDRVLERGSNGLSTENGSLTTTTRRHGEETPGVNTDEAAAQKNPPRVTLVHVAGLARPQNLGFNALAEECRADVRSRSGEITAALKKIRQFAWDELQEARARGFLSEPHDDVAFERYLAEMIRLRAALYQKRMKGATLTPTALAKWWFDVEKLPEQGLTPDEIARGEY
jgi:hypothetical protein